MNRKQMVVLWIAVLWFSFVSIGYGIDPRGAPKNLFYLLILPVILIGSLLIYQFRNKDKPPKAPTSMIPKLLVLILAAFIIQVFFVYQTTKWTGLIQGDILSIEYDINTIQSDISSVESEVSSIQYDVDDIQSNISKR